MATGIHTPTLSKRHFLAALAVAPIAGMVSAQGSYSAIIAEYRAHLSAFPADEAAHDAWHDRCTDLLTRWMAATPENEGDALEGLRFIEDMLSRAEGDPEHHAQIMRACIARLSA